MNTEEIQKRVNALSDAMLAKGLREPKAEATIESNTEPNVYLRWKDVTKAIPSAFDGQSEFLRAGTIGEALEKADKFVAEMPSAEEAKVAQFMGALANVIELGKDNGVDVEFLNPLKATMKKLSDNILTDQRSVA